MHSLEQQPGMKPCMAIVIGLWLHICTHPFLSCSERQLALWYQYDIAQKAAAQSLALQTQQGHTPLDCQIAAALGLSLPFSTSKCLAAGKVHMVLCLAQELLVLLWTISVRGCWRDLWDLMLGKTGSAVAVRMSL